MFDKVEAKASYTAGQIDELFSGKQFQWIYLSVNQPLILAE